MYRYIIRTYLPHYFPILLKKKLPVPSNFLQHASFILYAEYIYLLYIIQLQYWEIYNSDYYIITYNVKFIYIHNIAKDNDSKQRYEYFVLFVRATRMVAVRLMPFFKVPKYAVKRSASV